MKELFDPIEETNFLNEDGFLTTRNFMVAIYEPKKERYIFRPCEFCNFSTDKNKVFITMYDMIGKETAEEVLDYLQKGFWVFKKKVNIILFRLDKTNTEIYRVEYVGCKLRNYHGKNFTYNSDTNHQWYLEFSFKDKKIVKNAKNKIKADPDKIKKELSIIKNSNRMLNDAIDNVKKSKKLNRNWKEKSIQLIDKAKTENTITEHFLSSKLETPKLPQTDFSKIEKDVMKKIADLEDMN